MVTPAVTPRAMVPRIRVTGPSARDAVLDDGLDSMLTSVDCAREFFVSAEDTRHFAASGYLRPRRCRPCASARRRWQRQQDADLT